MILAVLLALAAPADWVPARWNWTDPATLELLAGTPINCLLVTAPDAAFAAKAAGKGIATLAVAASGSDAVALANAAIEAKMQGVVLEGDFEPGTVKQVHQAVDGKGGVVIELPSRNRLRFESGPVTGTWQGVWPGIHVLEGGAAKAAPTGSPWIDTNTGFLRAARARTGATLWIGNLPPRGTVLSAERYLHAIGDAAIVGGRWIVALDDDLAARLKRGEPAAVKTWQRMAAHLNFFEKHREWRSFQPHARLAVIQDLGSGALLSGSILDMIGARHTPMRAVPREKLSKETLAGATMAVSVDPDTLDPQQQEMLTNFRRGGGTVLTPPPGSHIRPPADSKRITLDDSQVEHLTEIWRDVQSMIGRRNLGVRMFNVAGMLSSLTAGPGGKPVIIQLVNYTSYPVENVTVHLLGSCERARLLTPEGGERALEIYKTEEGAGIDIDLVSTAVAIRID